MATQPAMFPEIESPDFVKSDEIRETGEAVIRLHGGIGGVPRLHPIAEAVGEGELSILWLLNTRPFDPDKDADEHGVAGKCVKAPALWRDVTGYHFAIWIREHFWAEWPTDVQRAAVLHELLHIDVERDKNGQAKFSVRKHDVEDFVDVVRQYGPLFGDGARLVRAAAQHAGEPEPIGKRPVADIAHAVVDALSDANGVPDGAREHVHNEVNAAAAVKPLQELADSTGTDITFAARGRSVTIKGRKDQALADATAHRLGRSKAQAAARPVVTPDDRVGTLECQGSNHVPGHTPGCAMYVVS